PDHLQKAAHIFRYLGRSFEKISTLGRLAALYRKLHDDPRAREYEAGYTAVFQRRMHRVSATEVATVAARRYLPLGALRRARLSPATAPTEPQTVRERAIEAFLRFDVEAAREGLREGDQLLDRKYLADLALISGDLTAAREGFLAALREDPDDPRVLDALI